jgi:hypothetical protein
VYTQAISDRRAAQKECLRLQQNPGLTDYMVGNVWMFQKEK